METHQNSSPDNSPKKILKTLALIGLNMASSKIEDSINAVKCKHCCQKNTNYMTVCCHQPICHSCFFKYREYKDAEFPFGVGRSSYWGETTFRCPFCQKQMSKTNYDPDSMAAVYQVGNHGDIYFVIRIDNPEEGGWS